MPSFLGLFLISFSVVCFASGGIPEADQFFSQKNPAKAKSVLEDWLKSHPKDVGALWRLSRAWLLSGDEAPPSEQNTYYTQAFERANEAVTLDARSAAALIRRAAANGKLALFLGPLKAKDKVNAMREDLEKALTLSPDKEDEALANYILGRTHLKLTETPLVLRKPLGLGWGKLESAVSFLARAVELKPAVISFQLEVGKALLKAGKKDEAVQHWKTAAGLKPVDHGDDARLKEVQEWLAK
jgi:tetratricopeptide (TPR) repeat protein